MAYNQNYGYGQAGSHYPQTYPQQNYPQQPSNANPFASEADLNGPSASYPPTGGHPAGSSWSLDEEPLKTGPGAAGTSYSGVQRSNTNPFAANYKESGSGVKKWIIIAIGVLIVIGVAVGIAVWRVKANDSSSSSSSSSGSSGKQQFIDGTAKVVKSNPNDPSDFQKDSRLKPIFYGMAYTPLNVLEEYGCGATLANVTEDMQLLSQLTTRIRTYASACNQTELVLQAIQDTKVNMTVWLGAYIGEDTTVNSQQQENILDALKKYGADHVGGITIGNEYILDQTNKATAISYITQQVADFNTSLLALNLGKHIPVGTADAGFVYNTTLAEGIDEYLANVHPWFGGVPIDQAAGWTWDYFTQNDVSVSEKVANNPVPYIAETGWPTQSMTPENATLGGAVAGVSQLQTFLDTYPCQANKNQSYYFYFEPFDEPWKERYGGVEPYWGLFDSNKILKDITFPDCEVDSTTASG
ncbi:hypothetical protein JCM11641_002479 [Rhodosporidiobolus odoratus]